MANYKKHLLNDVIRRYGFEDKRTIKFAKFLERTRNIDTIMTRYKQYMA